MNNEQLAAIKAILEKHGLKEQRMAKGIFMDEKGSGISANLRGDKPIVGMMINDTVQPDGNSNAEITAIQREVEAIMQSKKSQSSVGTQSRQMSEPAKPLPEVKLGAGDTSLKTGEPKKGTTTAICKGCACTISGTIDTFRKIQDEYGVIYCQKCSEAADGKHDVPEMTPKASAKPEQKTIIKTCKSCGLELSGARALECFQKEKEFVCEECEDKPNGGNEMVEAEIVDQKSNLPAKAKQEFKVGTCEAVALQYGIPAELANLFFMKMNEGLYIKNPGLLYLGAKKGYSRIEITTIGDDKAGWSSECKIFPKLTKDILEGIAKLDKDLQKIAFEFATQPTNGTGRASTASVKMTSMHAFLKEMSQTRAQNRALRAFTGYGGTSAEELPEAQLERD
jgi:hypothetical protein